KSLALPRGTPLGEALEDVLAVGDELDLRARRNERQPFDRRRQLGDLVGAEADVAEVIRLAAAVRRDEDGTPSGRAGVGRRARATRSAAGRAPTSAAGCSSGSGPPRPRS